MQTSVIIVAAGSGTRLGYGMPKAAVPLGQGSILSHCLQRVPANFAEQIIVVVPQDHQGLASQVERFAEQRPDLEVIHVGGGSSRAESVSNGMAALKGGTAAVLIHDAARPLTPEPVWDRVKAALANGADAVIPGLPLVDTIKEVRDATVVTTVDRSKLFAVQTPQGFNVDQLRKAQAFLVTLEPSEQARITDEALLMEQAGIPVTTVEGSALALKITTAEDHHFAQLLLQDLQRT